MDTSGDIAEERLLRAIEGGGPPQPSDQPQEWVTPPTFFKRLWEKLQKLINSLMRHHKSNQSKQFHITLRGINNIFWVVLGMLILYLVLDFLIFQFQTKHTYVLVPHPEEHSVGDDAGVRSIGGGSSLKPVSHYLGALEKRNPFTGSANVSKKEDVRSVESELELLTKSLVVVGVNRGVVKEALIEDTEEKRTYFVKEGEAIKGMILEVIKDDGLILSYDEEEIEIG